LRPGREVIFEYELERLGVQFKNSRPYHPQTCGKVERLHQTLKRYLARQAPAETLVALQEQLDGFLHYYNHIRPQGRKWGSQGSYSRPEADAGERPTAAQVNESRFSRSSATS
jgi:hypothetical protein